MTSRFKILPLSEHLVIRVYTIRDMYSEYYTMTGPILDSPRIQRITATVERVLCIILYIQLEASIVQFV